MQVTGASYSQPALAPPATSAMQPEASQAPAAAPGAHTAEGSAAGLHQEAAAAVQKASSGEFDMSQILNLSGGSLPTSA